MASQTLRQYQQDLVLAVAYTTLALLAARKVYLNFSTDGSGRVLTAFYGLIFTAGFLRAVWFFIPSRLETATTVSHVLTGRLVSNLLFVAC